VITEPAVAFVGETARVVDVLLIASAAVERKRMLKIKNTGLREESVRLRGMLFRVVTV
jgi:hypothetical protein